MAKSDVKLAARNSVSTSEDEPSQENVVIGADENREGYLGVVVSAATSCGFTEPDREAHHPHHVCESVEDRLTEAYLSKVVLPVRFTPEAPCFQRPHEFGSGTPDGR